MDTLPLVQSTVNLTGITQKIAIGAVANQSNQVLANQILLVSTVACHVTFDGTAATGISFYLPANVYIVIDVHNPIAQVSVIQDSVAGSLYITGVN